MRKIILSLSFSILFQFVFSQSDSVLRKFKYRIDHYQAIDFSIGAAGSISHTEYPSVFDKNNSSGGNLGANYYFLKSTDHILLSFSGGISTAFNFSKNENATEENRNKSSYSAINLSLLNKWFSGNSFTELGLDGFSGIQLNKMTATSPPGYYRNKEYHPSLTLHLGIGKGRLENITDMQNALWLYKYLREENKLPGQLTAEELNKLGSTITKANNTRILDSRRRTRFILETVDHFFQENKLIPVPDIRYFTNLNDILFFAINNNRLSGTEKYIRLTPAIDFLNRNQWDDILVTKYENRVTTKTARLSAGFGRYRPVNLIHQNEYGASLFLNYIVQDFTEKFYNAGVLSVQANSNPEIKQAGLNFFFRHSIYPNTRTSFNFTLQSEDGYEDIGGGDTGFFGRADLSGSLNYFISYRTRFSCSIGTTYQKNYYVAAQDLQLLPDTWQAFFNAGVVVNL
jgi:hypothetical protein